MQGKSQTKPGQGRPSYIVLVVLAGASPCLGLPVASGFWVPFSASQSVPARQIGWLERRYLGAACRASGISPKAADLAAAAVRRELFSGGRKDCDEPGSIGRRLSGRVWLRWHSLAVSAQLVLVLAATRRSATWRSIAVDAPLRTMTETIHVALTE